MEEINIICENCGQPVKIEQALHKTFKNQFFQQIQQQQQIELEKQKRQLEQEFQNKSRSNQTEIAEESKLAKQREEEYRQKISQLLEQLNQAQIKNQDSDIRLQEQLLQERERMKQEARKESDATWRLQLEEERKKVAELEKQASEMQRKATRSTGQLQGETLELSLEQDLKDEFKDDVIEEVPKWAKGADIMHTVCNSQGESCGIILWESKRTRLWKNEWIVKLKEDLIQSKSTTPAIVSSTFPREDMPDIVLYQGVWLAKPPMALILAKLLRIPLLEAKKAQIINQHRETNAESLYNFMTSSEFVQRLESIIQIIIDSKNDIAKERGILEKNLAKREARIDKLFKDNVHLIGSIEGVIGDNAMPKIKGLELESLNSSS